MPPYILAYDSDEDAVPFLSKSHHTPTAAGRTNRQTPRDGIAAAEKSALCAETLLRLHFTADAQTARDAALSQLSRFRGAYGALCRGAPLSVWGRHERECAAVVDETADFFRYELQELVHARRTRERSRSDGRPTTTRADLVTLRRPGFRFIGSRGPLPASTPPEKTQPERRSVCQLHDTCADADAARLHAQLTSGERLAMTLLSIEREPTSATSGLRAAHDGGCASVVAGTVDDLSPFAIYADDQHALEQSVLTVVPFYEAAATATPGVAEAAQGTSADSTRASKRQREDSQHSCRTVARKLDFEPTQHVPSSTLASLSECVVEQHSQKALQDWLRASHEPFLIPY